MQIDEAAVKLITEVVIRVLAEMNKTPAPAAAPVQEKPCAGPSPCCENGAAASPVIPGRGCGRDLITEREAMEMIAAKQTTFVCSEKTIITSLAEDRLKAAGIRVVRR